MPRAGRAAEIGMPILAHDGSKSRDFRTAAHRHAGAERGTHASNGTGLATPGANPTPDSCLAPGPGDREGAEDPWTARRLRRRPRPVELLSQPSNCRLQLGSTAVPGDDTRHPPVTPRFRTSFCCDKWFVSRAPSFRSGSCSGNPLRISDSSGFPMRGPGRKDGVLGARQLLHQERIRELHPCQCTPD